MENKLIVLEYEGNPIAFDFSKLNQMVNATEMGKIFGRTPKDFLRNQKIKDYIVALAARQNCLPTDLVKIVKGNFAHHSQGTWMNRFLAIRFAQWLNPDFAVWVDIKIEELLTTGHTSIQPKSDRELVIIGLEAANREIKKLEQENKVLTKEIEELTPDAEFARRLKASPDKLFIGEAAKLLAFKDMGQNKLFEFLRANKILGNGHNNRKKNQPYQRYINNGYFTWGIHKNDKNLSFYAPQVSHKGVEFIYKKLRQKGHTPISEKSLFDYKKYNK